MPKKPKINNRLDKLFQEIHPEEASTPEKKSPVETKKDAGRESVPAAPASKPVERKSLQIEPPTPTVKKRAPELVSVSASENIQQDMANVSAYSLNIQTGYSEWSVLRVMDDSPEREWTPDEQLLIKQVSDQLSLALENARLFQDAQERAEELNVLNEMAIALSAETDVKQICETSYRFTSKLVDTTNYLIATYDEQAGNIHFPLTVLDNRRLEGASRKIETGSGTLTDYVIRNKETLLIPNNVPERTKSLGLKSIGSEQVIQCWLGVPLLVGNRAIGALIVQSLEQPNLYTERERDLLQSVGNQVATALENARLFQETQERANELALVNRVISVLTGAASLQEALQTVITEIVEAYPVTRGAVTMLDENKTNIVIVADHSKRANDSVIGLAIPMEGNLATQTVIDTHKPFVIYNPAENEINPLEARQAFRDMGVTYTAIFPIIVNEEVVGTLGVDMDKPGDSLTPRQIDLLETALAPISTAISRLRAEEELYKSQERYALAAEGANDGLWDWDIAHGEIYYSPRWKSMLGFEEHELTRGFADWEELIHPEDHEYATKSLNDYLEQKAEAYDVEIRLRHKDGMYRWIRDRGKALRDENGKAIRMAGSHTDITERKQAEETIRRRNEYLAASSEIGKIVTSTLDLNTIFARTVNLITQRFNFYHASIFIVEETGFKAVLREATGAAGAEMKKNKHALPVNSSSIVGNVSSEGKSVVVNDVTLDPLHKPNPLLPDTRAEAAIPLKIGNRVIGAIDIQAKEAGAFTEDDIAVLQTLADQIAVSIDNARSFELSQQAVMEMREADRLKSQFLANMSHELRTPLNSIIGFSRVILKGIDGPVTELQQQDLTAIYNSGQHLLGLINDILDFSKIEAGKMELAFDEVNIADITASVLSTMSGLVKDKPVQLKSYIEPDMPTVRADTIRIRQVLINLLSNAAKFTDEGDISVNVNLVRGSSGRREVCIGVTDTGPGIGPEDQKKLFQAFSQVDDSPTRKTGGTGLGLAICQELVKMHGGRIWVESEVGKGSTFKFTLQLFRPDKIAETPTTNENKVILSIDDDKQVTNLYERYLQPQGYQVVSLSEPARALERVKQLKPFAVTLDIMMPGVDGWQILEMLKNDPETRHIPVIVCSILDDLEKGYSLGAADYLVKPIIEDDLVNALDRLNSDGSIREVLVIDDDPNDLRLLGKILNDDGRYKATLSEGGRPGWDLISSGKPPHAVILDLFMPEMNGFEILAKMRTDERLRDIPIIVISGVDLNAEQKKQLNDFGQGLLLKGSLTEKELLTTIQRTLERARKKDQ